jgi:spore germination protein
LTPVTLSYRTYTIQLGDTLFGIAVRFDTSVEAITRINRIGDPDRILAGELLVLPAAGE